MATSRLAPSIRAAMAAALMAELTGGGPYELRIYSGAMPAALGAVTSQVLLAALEVPDPVGIHSGAVVTFDSIAPVATLADGDAAWARLVDGAENALADFDVTGTAGTGAVRLAGGTTIESGGSVEVASFTFTIGGA